MRRLGNPVYWLIAAVLILASAVGYLFWRVHQIDREEIIGTEIL